MQIALCILHLHHHKMKQYRHILEKGSKKFNCPACNKKTFTRYIDTVTNLRLPEQYGKCDRINNCSYFITPPKNNNVEEFTYTPAPEKPVYFIPEYVMQQSFRKYRENTFIQFLILLFGENEAARLVEMYRIGTSSYREGATVFWYVDHFNYPNYGRVIGYKLHPSDDSVTGFNCKREKDKNSHCASILTKEYQAQEKPLPEWLSLYNTNDTVINCLFGAHLTTRDKNKKIAVVESEKTAVIAAGYFPEFIWLATGGQGNLKPKRSQSLIGRDVVLFPDLGAYDTWVKYAKDFHYVNSCTVSDLLETKASEKEREGSYDLADYLIQFPVEQFRGASVSNDEEKVQTELEEMPEQEQYNIEELESIFSLLSFTGPVQLDNYTTLQDPHRFIRTHIATLRANKPSVYVNPYYNRLQQLKTNLINNK